jgi:toxin ParE1/3/4
MGEVARTRTATREIRGIVRRIACDRLSAAIDWLEEIERVLRLLASHPEAGERHRFGRHGLVRRHVVGNYVIYFRPQSTGILVLRVIHAARDLHS